MNTSGKKINIQELTKIALCVAILCISSYLIIPLPFTPIVLSMQTIMVNVIGLILRPRHAACAVMVYLLMGLIGLPVFSAGTAGAGKLFGLTGGYYFGFLFAVIVISALKGQKRNLKRYCAITIGIGIPIQHFAAVLMMCIHNGFQIEAAFLTISLPFLLGDIVKCVMASIIGVALNKVLHRE